MIPYEKNHYINPLQIVQMVDHPQSRTSMRVLRCYMANGATIEITNNIDSIKEEIDKIVKGRKK